MKIDWHTHTIEGSNESEPVRDVVRKAKAVALGALAITDHNSTDAIEAARVYAGNDLTIIPGLELDATIEGERGHILCFYPDYGTYKFQDELAEFNSRRAERMFDTARKFADVGLIPEADSESAVRKLRTMKGSLTRMAVANVMLDLYTDTNTPLGLGIRGLEVNSDDRDMTTKFLYKFLDKRSDEEISCYIGYEPQYSVDYVDVMKFCKRHNGVFGFAHLMKDIPDRKLAQSAFENAVNCGAEIIGYEHPDHNDEDLRFLNSINTNESIRLNGTDYHARKDKPDLGSINSDQYSLDLVLMYAAEVRR